MVVQKHIAPLITSGRAQEIGQINEKTDGPYHLICYTRKAVFSTLNRAEEACRGLVIDDDGKICALPMPKFYNLGEPRCKQPPGLPYTITEKVDGSLGIFWYSSREQRWRCNTKGGFDNPYTSFASSHWESNVDDSWIPKHFTIMVEIVFDDDPQPRAAQHPEGLYLVAVRDNYSGTDLPTSIIDAPGLAHPKVYHDTDIDTLLGMRDQTGTEGWVVRFDNGFRVKIKTRWYLNMFKAIDRLNPKAIRELMIQHGEDWIGQMPDDLQAEAVEIQNEIESSYRQQITHIYEAYSKLSQYQTRKEFAIHATSEYPQISHHLFRLLDGTFEETDVLSSMNL
jgi:RNA ligase